MSETVQYQTWPLSFSQRNIWDLERAFEGTSINNISTTLKIQGRVDFALLQKTLNLMIEKDPSLRSRITIMEGEPVWYTAPYVRENFPIYDFSGAGEKGLKVWEDTLTREPISVLRSPLYRFVLFRTGEHSGGVFIKIHHIASDGWSQALVCNRIAQTYLEHLYGGEAMLEESPGYELHVQEEREYIGSGHYERDRRYWKEQLSHYHMPSVIKDLKGAEISPVGRRVSFQLPQHLNHAIYTFCMENRVAPFAVFYMALAIYFKHIRGEEIFTIGVPIFNRTSYVFKQCTGMFVSTLPFINEIDGEWTFKEFNEKLAESWYELLRHQRFPFKDITAMANAPDGRLFQVALSYQDSRVYESHDTSVTFSGRWHYSGYQAEQLCIHLSNLDSPRQYAVDYDYLTQFFSEEEIAVFHFCLMNLLSKAFANPNMKISQLSMLSADVQEKVLYTFNRTTRYIGKADAYQIFSNTARRYPKRAALIWQGERLTYQELAGMAVTVSEALSRMVPGKKGLAAICLPRQFSLFAGILGTLRLGWGYLLISQETPKLRALEILNQSQADVLITDLASAGELQEKGLSIPILDGDGILPAAGESIESRHESSLEDLAYVVYTSGSTGKPKGVEITQKSLVNLAQAMSTVYGGGAVLSMCSIGFDAFVLESSAALLNGRTIVLPTEEELESPRRLARLITGYAVGFMATTPSRLFFLSKEETFSRALANLEAIVCGGESFPRELLVKLSMCTEARIYNQYGPSEATVAVSHKLLNQAAAITAGSPLQNCRLYVLDEWRKPLPTGVYGELYIGGACVGRGYRNDPKLTEERFFPSPFESDERIYRTGDIACWTEDGEIILAGRKDRQIKLRGLRVEPQEISSCIASHPGVSDAAARVLTVAGQTVIAVYYTSDTELSEVELLTFAASYLPHYMLPSFVIRVDSIPLTSNGKVDESRLPLPQVGDELSQDTEDSLVRMIMEIFSHTLERRVGPDSDYFLSGGSSLSAMQTLSELEDAAGCLLKVSDLYACRTARLLARYIRQARGENIVQRKNPVRGIPRRVQKDRYPLSPVQKGIYFQTMLDPSGLLYNMSGAFLLKEAPEKERLQKAFEKLIAGEELLRTSFRQEPEGIFAFVEDKVSFELQKVLAGNIQEAIEGFSAPFDLSKAPLLRAGLWRDPQGQVYLLLDSHHIIGDGLTTPILLERLSAYYEGKNPRLPERTYLDYACWLDEQGGAGDEDKEYWRDHLTPMPEPLDLPGDHARSKTISFQGEKYVLALPEELGKEIQEFCRSRNLSAYHLFLGAFGYLLSKLTGKKELIVGSPVTDRTRPELKQVCGPFINVMPVKIQAEEEICAGEYLEKIRREAADMMDHSRCTPEEIVSLLGLKGEPGKSPLYSVILSMRPFDDAALSFDGKPVEYAAADTKTAKADLGLDIGQKGYIYTMSFEYAAELFERETIALYARCMQTLMAQMMTGEKKKLAELEILDFSDRETFFDIPDHTFRPYLNLPVHEGARREALRRPEEAAVIFHGQTTTRIQLEERACQIANALAAAGVRPGERVGLSMKRTPEFFASMLGILKNGCAYVPLLSDLPEKRLLYMVRTAGIERILCDASTEEILPKELRKIALIPGKEEPKKFSGAMAGPEDLINVLFTSGSTGKPKGVMIRHRSIANLLANMKEALECVTRPMICATTPVFDIFITESLLPLAMGKTIILADEEEMLLPWKLAELMEKYQVGFIQFTASRLAMCLTNESFCRASRHLQFTIVGGEQVTPALVSKFKEQGGGRLVNLYGPTEAAVYITMTDLQENEDVTIGRPLGNCRVYVMDENQNRLLPTAVGELYLAGEGVAAGYIGREDLTSAAFFPDPFVPGSRMYRSGDLGRLRTDGRLECLGRLDAQVKINGQRLEIDEIVNVMMDSGMADQAVVLPIPKENSGVELHAFCAGMADGSQEQLKEYMREYLPDYMIPSRFHLLKEMPYTTGGKADLTRLKEMAAEGKAEPVKKEYVKEESALNTVEDLLEIWKEVLGRKELKQDESFFDQGGTSLGVLTALSHYFNQGIQMSIEEFYRHPTAAGQAKLLGLGKGKEKAPKSSAAKRELPRYVPSKSGAGPELLETVFVTGATGFFGAHLVQALLAEGVKKVICLVRGGKSRLYEALAWYFGAGWAAGAAARIETISGDITLPFMGMKEAEYERTAVRVQAVYHCAADVRHYSSDEASFMDSNLKGTREAINLALRAGAVLHHMSSVSISGEYLPDAPERQAEFGEEDFYIGQNYLDNIYVKSKMLAEAQVYKAMEQEGLRAQVYRLGRLVSRSQDGVFQRNPENNMYYLFVNGIAALGALPKELEALTMDLTPVDFAAKAVVSLRGCGRTVLHIMNPAPASMGEMLLKLLPDMRILEAEEFDQYLQEAMAKERDNTEYPLLYNFLNNYRRHLVKIEPVCRQTRECLQRAGVGEESLTEEALLRGAAAVLKANTSL